MNPLTMVASRSRCLRTMRVLQAYLDGALEDVSSQKVAEHLEECRRCGLEADVYRSIKTSLGARRYDLDSRTVDDLRRFGGRLARDGEAGSGEAAF